LIRDFFWLTDKQFTRIKPHPPADTRGKPRVDHRGVISGIIHVLTSGARWVDPPSLYKTLYNRRVRCAAKDVWVSLFHALARAGGPPAHVLSESSAVKALLLLLGAEPILRGTAPPSLSDMRER
jgi:transposase